MSNISLVALRQLNEIELSGYILEVVGPYTGVTNTGSLTGNFYPLYGNPSGYLNSFSGLNTGDFVTYPVLTGNNIQLLATVGLLYYPNSNPSGFVTGGQTGVFYPLNSNPSGYITTGQTGAFAQSGNFYPLYSNPSGYLFLSGKTLNVPNINLSGGNLYSNQNIIVSSSGLFEFISPYGMGFEILNGAGSFEIIDSANSSTPFNYASSPNVFLLSDGMDFTSIDVVNRGLFDNMGNVSAAYSNRTLVDTGANITLDWNRKILSGVWNLGNNTGNFITTNQTGQFYPLNSNPSGYISRYGQSGAFIFSTPVTNGVNNQFINFPWSLGNSPSVLCTLNNNGAEFIEVQASGITSTGYWAQFSNTIDGTGYILSTLASLSTATGLATTVIIQNFSTGTTGAFYPLYTNPSGYITSGQTGAFGTAINTGSLTGQFYPLNSNPSGYISSLKTGAYIFSTQINSGVSKQFISFPYSLGNNPYVICNLNNISGTQLFVSGPSGMTSSGYWITFSSNIDNSGYSLTTLVNTSTLTGLATTVIINNFTTGSTGSYYPLNSNPSGYITTGQTGSLGTPANVVFTTGNQNINGIKTFDGVSGIVMLGSQLSTAGATLHKIGFFSDIFNTQIASIETQSAGTWAAGNYPTNIIFSTSTGLLQTDLETMRLSSRGQMGLLNNNPKYTLDVSGSGNFSNGLFIKGNPVLTGGPYYPLSFNPSGYITTGQTGAFATVYNQSGAFIFSTPVFSGSSQQFITFPAPLGINPIVLCGLTNSSGNLNILVQASGITSTGYWATFSQTINDNDHYLSTLASLSTATGLATTIIIQNISGTTGGYYPLNSNPSGYLPTGQLESTFLKYNIDLNNSILQGKWTISGIESNNNIILNPRYNIVLQAGQVSIGQNFDPQYQLDVDGNIGNSSGLNPNSYINVGSDLLIDASGNISVDWNNRILSGNWNLGNNTGNFITNNQTGRFYLNTNPSGFITGETIFISKSGSFLTTGQSGLFYPMNNPSGFITGFNTGNFITTGQTGAFASIINLITTGNYLFGLINASSAGVSSLNSASGALTINGAGNISVSTSAQTITVSGNTGAYMSFVLTGNTGIFYTNNNPSGFITGFNSGLYTLNSNTGNFITTGQTGQFYPNIGNPSGFILPSQTGAFASVINLGLTGNVLQLEINTLDTWTGISTGLYYPYNSNPNNYITNLQTGNFITTSQTGNFTSVAITGGNVTSYINLSGISGILVSTGISGLVLFNGLNLVQTSQTGTFITSSQTGTFASAINLGITGNTLQLEINSLNSWTGGSTGIYYPLNSNPDNYIMSSQTGIFVSTGMTGSYNSVFYPLNTNPLNYITSNQTGNYINTGETGAFASVINLNSTGSYLFGLINASSAGVSSLNSLSGILTLTGAGNVFIIDNGQTIIISGNTGMYSSFVLNSQTGQFYSTSNPSGFITGLNTGSFITTGQTGAFYSSNNPSGFALASNLLSTGITLETQLNAYIDITAPNTYATIIEVNALDIWTGSSTGIFYPYYSNPSGYLTGFNSGIYTLNSNTGIFITTGMTGAFITSINTGSLTGQFYPLNSNPSGYITALQTGNFSSIAVTGGPIQYYANLSGISGILVSTGISGLVLFNGLNLIQTSQTGAFASSINLNSTGSYLIGLINASSAGVSSLNSASGALTLIGAGNVSVSVAGENITISGNTGTYSSFVLTGNTGSFVTNTQTGTLNSQFINFLNTQGVSGIKTFGNGIYVDQISGYSSNALVNLSTQYLIDSNGNASVLWMQRSLENTGNIVTVNWQNQQLSGNWNAQALSISGSPVIINSQTGAFASVINLGITGNTLQLELNTLNNWTGTSTGLYYPYNSNPSGYLTGFNSGLYTLNSNTGSFITTSQTGSYSSAFYPLNSNPLNYITVAQTGNFTSVSITGGIVQSYINLSGISGMVVSTGISGLVLFNGINLVQTSQTGSFITTNQTGAFASAINLGITGNTLQLEINSLNSWTGTSTGLYYPLVNNPSNYITSGQTGNFITNSQTGAFASLINLGLTGNALQLEINSLSGYGNNNFATIINLFNTGSSLQSEINALSGNLTNSGYLISGALNNSGILLQNEINSLNIWSGNSTGLFYPYYSNPVGYNYEAVNKGLIFYYPFNEGSGTTIYDKANGIPATLTSGVTFTSGIFGGAINFTGPNTGSQEFVNVGTPSLLSGQTPITVCAWVNLSGTNLQNNNIIISKFLGGANGEFYLSIVGPNGIQFSTNASGGRQNIEFNAPYSLIDNNWHFGAATYDGFNTKLYCDGILLGNSTIQSGQLSGSNNSIYIGNYFGGSYQYNLSGSIAEPMVFNRTLSNQEIIYLNNKYALSNCLVSNYTNKTISGISSVFQSGSFLNSLTLDGNQVLTGVNTGLFITTGQTGAFYPYNSNPSGYLTSYLQSGSFVFSTTATSGINQQFVFFPGSLGTSPNVFCTLNNNTNELIEVQASGITSSGYWAQFSNTIDGSGYTISTIATLSTSTGFATTVIINSGINIPWYNLTWGTGTVWNANPNVVEDRVRLYLTGNTTLQINNLYNGWEGLLQTIQTGNSTTGYNITLPVGTKVMGNSSGILSLTTQSGAYDMTAFVYDSINLFCNIGNQFD